MRVTVEFSKLIAESNREISDVKEWQLSQEPVFDPLTVHRYFSAHCFNAAWELIDKADRTPAEEETMIQLSMASLWHWSQRPDCTDQNWSIGYWQVARIYTLLAQVENARHYGRLCLQHAQKEGVQPFALGYAYEALARAEAVAGNQAQMQGYLLQAHQVAETMTDLEDKEQLLADLDTIR
jgi:hypothetical protein